MKEIENNKIKEKIYMEKFENGLNVMFIPKKDTKKKYIIWGTKYGSNDSKFIIPGDEKVTEVPDGIAHFLEHKLFEQENGSNSLDVLSSLGVEANAYTTNDHTAYLFECTDNFYPALDELMNYVQNPYFTDENVEKEKGIIGQEIRMYDDYPEWVVYLNALKAMYYETPVKIDITGTIESIAKIDKEILYNCYNTFYNFSNMLLVVCGDFEKDEIFSEIKKRLEDKKPLGEIKRIYDKEPKEIVVKEKVAKFEVSQPVFIIGIKDNEYNTKDIVKKHIAIEIIMNMLIGNSSKLYKRLYENGNLFGTVGLDYEFTKYYAHILLTGQSPEPSVILEELKNEIKILKNNKINENDFERIKKAKYGAYIREYDDVALMSKMFLADYFKGINSFEYLEEIKKIDVEYLGETLKNVFKEENMVISIVKNN